MKKAVYLLSCLLFGILILAGGSDVTTCVRSGFTLWFESVLGTLFVCSLLCAALEGGGLSLRIGSLLSVLTKPFGIGAYAAYAGFTAAIGGFPLGIKALASGKASPTDGELAFATCPSVAFSVFTVGSLLRLSPTEALPLWLCPLGSALLLSLCSRPSDSVLTPVPLNPAGGARAFFFSLKTAAESLVYVGSCIALFSLLLGQIEPVLCRIAPWDGVVHMLLEIAGGCASLPAGSTAAAAGGLGFSGLCVVLQSFPYASACGVAPGRFVIIKAVQGILSYALCTAYTFFGLTVLWFYLGTVLLLISFRRVFHGRNANPPGIRRYNSHCRQ